VQSLKTFLLGYGAFGLFAIALLDSAMVPLAGGPDGVLLLLSSLNPTQAPLYALAATVGSLIGCLVLYQITRKAGEGALARIRPEKRMRLRELMDRHDLMTMIVAVLAPPPFPTKLVVLAAGVAGMRLKRFALGVLIGRVFRYSLEAYLAARFGSQAAEVLKENYPIVIVVALLVIPFLFWLNHLMKRSLTIPPRPE